MNEVLELCPSPLGAEDIYQDITFPEGKDGRPYVAINVVSSADGKATIGGRASRIGSELDHKLMRRVRAAADMVLIGAGTLRAENVNFALPDDLRQRRVARGMRPSVLAGVLSASGQLPLDRTFFQSKEFEPIVFVTEGAEPRLVREIETHARVLIAGEKTIDLGQLMGLLWDDLGVRRLVVEGGPGLNHAFVACGLADELLLTIAPKIVAGKEITPIEGPGLPGEGTAPMRLVSAYACESELFLRYLFIR